MCSECDGCYGPNRRLARMYLSELAGVHPATPVSRRFVMDRMLCVYHLDDSFAEQAAKGITTAGGLLEKLIELSNEDKD